MSVRAPVRAPSGGHRPSGFSPKTIAQKVSGVLDKVKDTVKNVANKVQAELQKDTFEKGPLAPHLKKFLEGFPGLKQPPATGGAGSPGDTQPLPYRPGDNPVQAENLLYRPGEHEVHINQVGTIKRPAPGLTTKGISKPFIV